jgi:hypothetical protein
MKYTDYRDSVRTELRRHPAGLTWAELQERLALPYGRPWP